MDVREKLVELLSEIIDGGFKWHNYLYESGEQLNNDEIASFLVTNGVTVQEWISVDDRLPERPPDRVDEQGRSWFTPNIDCIVYDGKSVFAANYCFQNKCFWYTNSLEPLNNITHWMPMPNPPKGE